MGQPLLALLRRNVVVLARLEERRDRRRQVEMAGLTKLRWMVGQMRVAKRDELTVEIMEKGGIQGVPFAGIVLVGPGGDNDG